MKKLTQITTLIAAIAILAVPAFSDTLVLKSGERVAGLFEGGSARVIKFRLSDGTVKDYDLLAIQQIQFGENNGGTTSTSPSTSLRSSGSSTAAAPAPAGP